MKCPRLILPAEALAGWAGQALRREIIDLIADIENLTRATEVQIDSEFLSGSRGFRML